MRSNNSLTRMSPDMTALEMFAGRQGGKDKEINTETKFKYWELWTDLKTINHMLSEHWCPLCDSGAGRVIFSRANLIDRLGHLCCVFRFNNGDASIVSLHEAVQFIC